MRKLASAYLTRLVLSCLVAAACLASAGPANAGYVVTLIQTVTDFGQPVVVATGSGWFNLAAIPITGGSFDDALIAPAAGMIVTGGIADCPDCASTVFSLPSFHGPSAFGTGPSAGLTTLSAYFSTGILVGINPAAAELIVTDAIGYTSDTAISDSAAYWLGWTFDTLGVMPGTYEWTWSGVDQSFTLDIKAPVPEASTLALLGVGPLCWLGFCLVRRVVRTRRGFATLSGCKWEANPAIPDQVLDNLTALNTMHAVPCHKNSSVL